MKKVILALLLIVLILVAGCESKEIKLRKQAQEIELDKLKSQAIEECTQLVNEDDCADVFCLAERATEIEEIYVGFRGETMVDYPNDFIDVLCSESSNPGLCYFYEAILTKSQNSCYKTDVEEGCRLIVYEDYCKGVINRNECLVDKAFLMRFINKTKAEKICRMVPPDFGRLNEDDFSCADIDFGESEYDNDTFEDQVFLMYVFAKLAGFEVSKIRVPG